MVDTCYDLGMLFLLGVLATMFGVTAVNAADNLNNSTTVSPGPVIALVACITALLLMGLFYAKVMIA